jgi:hypothetical protein
MPGSVEKPLASLSKSRLKKPTLPRNWNVAYRFFAGNAAAEL